MNSGAGPQRMELIGVGIALSGIAISSYWNYLLFHSLAELFSIIIAVGIFVIGWNARGYLEQGFLPFLSISYLFVGLIDLIHALAYTGMGVFPDAGPNLPTQLWIGGRLLEAAALLISLRFLDRSAPIAATWYGMTAVTTLLLSSIALGAFPVAFDPVEGLTPFKILAEWVVVICFGAVFVLLGKGKNIFSPDVLVQLRGFVVLRMASEIAFTRYEQVFAFENMLGHLLKIVGFFLLYRAIVRTGVSEPQRLIFQELDQQNRRLEGLVRELESFSMSAAHDLRAPLRRISSFCELLLRSNENLDADQLHYLDRIERSTIRMNELISSILSLSKIDRSPMELETVDLVDLVSGVIDEIRDQNPERTIRLEMDSELSVYGSSRFLRIALQNLVENAVKFTAREPICRIWIHRIESKPDLDIFTIRDNGIGFEPESRDRIFDPLHRLHAEDEFPGSGIGLATVRRIIHRHQGSVWAESTPGNGATFFISLPARPSDGKRRFSELRRLHALPGPQHPHPTPS